jgi:hypothetical protein
MLSARLRSLKSTRCTELLAKPHRRHSFCRPAANERSFLEKHA